MSCFIQLGAVCALMFWIDTTQSTPLFQGFSVQRGFEVKLQPFQFKPISIFKEKWSPFGMFGVRKGIQKRDLGETTNKEISPAPVFEHIDESKPTEVLKPLSSNLIRLPLTDSLNSLTEDLYTSISRSSSPENPAQPVIEKMYGELPPRPIGPIPEPTAIIPRQLMDPVHIQPVNPMPIQPANPGLIQPVSPIPIRPISPVFIQPVTPIPVQPSNPVLIQPISPIPIRPTNPVFIQPVSPTPIQPASSMLIQPVNQMSLPVVPMPPQPENPTPVQQVGFISGQVQPSILQRLTLVTPPPLPVTPAVPLSEIPPTDGPLVRGSKVAMYLGNVFVQLVSQFLTNARLQISQLKLASPPPV